MDSLELSYAASDAALRTLEEGGGTFDAHTLASVSPDSGYAVGITPYTAISARTFPAVRTALYVRALTALDGATVPPYIGTWMHAGLVYIDRVIILPDRESALLLARALGERAIYDFEHGESIDV